MGKRPLVRSGGQTAQLGSGAVLEGHQAALVSGGNIKTLFGQSLLGSGAVVPRQTINAQTGTTFTPALADAGGLVTLNNTAAIAVTIPANASAAFEVGDSVDFAQIGAGQVTIAPASGVTLIATPGLKLRDKGSACSAIKIATNTWLVIGDLTT